MHKSKIQKRSAPSAGFYSESLRTLTKEVASVGSADGNYVGKFCLVQKASKFAPDENEVSFLQRHVLQVYLIFVIQLFYTGMVSLYMYLHPELLLKLLNILFSAHGLVFLALCFVLFVLLIFAQETDSLLLGMAATIGVTTAVGIVMGLVPIFYDRNLIFEALVLTIIIYLGSALFGMLTRNNLTGWGTPLFGGLLALIAFGFFQHYYTNSLLNIVILVADIIIFTLYSAYDNQMIKIRFLDKLRDGVPDSGKSWWLLAMSSSIDIYLDFINLFLDILNLLGDDDD